MFKDKSVIAIIPARGGSKRIPKKNIHPLAGQPMIFWTIHAALESKYVDKILVSTDSEEIQDYAIESGAECPFLRTEASDDHSPVSEATCGALIQAELEWEKEFDVVIQLMPNCPLRSSTDIDLAVEKFGKDDDLSLISFFKYGWMNPWWAHTLDGSSVTPLFKDLLTSRSQDLDELYCPSGAIWVTSGNLLKESKTFYVEGYSSFIISWISALDIDEMEDLYMAEGVFELIKKHPNIDESKHSQLTPYLN